MPTLSITVPTEVAIRIQEAYGVNSLVDLKAKIILDIKNKVIAHEIRVAHEAVENSINNAIETARTTAETDIQLT